jgi:predicted nucleic acid-binding protein
VSEIVGGDLLGRPFLRNSMKIYLDSCCYNRPYDGYTAAQSLAEVAAIKTIIDICGNVGFAMVGSFATEDEIDKIRILDKWRQVRKYYDATITERVSLTAGISVRAQLLQVQGLKKMDSFHLACAEATGADFLITTDIRFINAYERFKFSFVRIVNPIDFLPEVKK